MQFLMQETVLFLSFQWCFLNVLCVFLPAMGIMFPVVFYLLFLPIGEKGLIISFLAVKDWHHNPFLATASAAGGQAQPTAED